MFVRSSLHKKYYPICSDREREMFLKDNFSELANFLHDKKCVLFDKWLGLHKKYLSFATKEKRVLNFFDVRMLLYYERKVKKCNDELDYVSRLYRKVLDNEIEICEANSILELDNDRYCYNLCFLFFGTLVPTLFYCVAGLFNTN